MAKVIKKQVDSGNVDKSVVIIGTLDEARRVIAKFTARVVKNGGAYALDTETGGLYWYKNPLYMISLYTPHHPAVVVPVAWPSSGVSVSDLCELFAPLCGNADIVCYLFNAKFDMHFMESAGVMMRNKIVDVRVLGHLINNTIPNQLKVRARTHANMNLIEFNVLFKLGRGKTLLDYAVNDVGKYAADDAIATYKLALKYGGKGFHTEGFTVGDDPELTQLYKRVEHLLTPILYRMERRGVLLDVENVIKYRAKTIPKLKELEKAAIEAAGVPINIRSPKQILEVLVRRGHTINSTEAALLEAIYKSTRDEFIGKLLEYRGLQKLMSTYVDSLLEGRSVNDVIHTSFNQVGTVTGRLSSSDPNL